MPYRFFQQPGWFRYQPPLYRAYDLDAANELVQFDQRLRGDNQGFDLIEANGEKIRLSLKARNARVDQERIFIEIIPQSMTLLTEVILKVVCAVFPQIHFDDNWWLATPQLLAHVCGQEFPEGTATPPTVDPEKGDKETAAALTRDPVQIKPDQQRNLVKLYFYSNSGDLVIHSTCYIQSTIFNGRKDCVRLRQSMPHGWPISRARCSPRGGALVQERACFR